MRKFYFTMGKDENLPYQEGYVVVWAANIKVACQKFMQAYPPIKPWCTKPWSNNILRCQHIYEEGEDYGPLNGPQQDVIGWPD